MNIIALSVLEPPNGRFFASGFTFLALAYSGCAGKEAIKWVSLRGSSFEVYATRCTANSAAVWCLKLPKPSEVNSLHSVLLFAFEQGSRRKSSAASWQ